MTIIGSTKSHSELISPIISVTAVQSALNAMIRYGSEPKYNPLLELELIDEYLDFPDSPASLLNRRMTLEYFLARTISNEFRRHYPSPQLPPVDSRISREGFYDFIRRVPKQQNQLFLGWACLYCIYVRADWSITPEFFRTKILFVDQRTFRRYQKNMMTKLTEKIVMLERGARYRQRKKRLYRSLPSIHATPIVGHQKQFNDAEHLLPRISPPHLQIIGKTGSGKTTFAQELVRLLIDKDEIDHLIWISAPTSVIAIKQALQNALSRNLDRAAVVLDNIDDLLPEMEALQDLYEELGHMIVIATASTVFRFKNPIPHLDLREMSQQESYAFIAALLASYYHLSGSEVVQNISEEVWAQAGGHPRAIKQAIFDLQELFYEENHL